MKLAGSCLGLLFSRTFLSLLLLCVSRSRLTIRTNRSTNSGVVQDITFAPLARSIGNITRLSHLQLLGIDRLSSIIANLLYVKRTYLRKQYTVTIQALLIRV